MQQKTFDLTILNGVNGFSIPGVAAGGGLGRFVSAAGDPNGDGINDFLLSAPFANSLAGTIYVVFGSRGRFPALFDLNNLNGSNGFVVPGLGGQLSAISGAGDINGDGISDLIFGASLTARGTGYVIFGSQGVFPASFNLTTLNGANGFTISGIAVGDYLGSVVGSAGDINGDGIDDVILVAYLANSGAGISYVIFGSRAGFPASFNLNTLNGVNGFTIPGIVPSGYLGYAASGLGDINGDGIDDLGLAAGSTSGSTGTAYVIFGSRTTFPSSFNLSTLSGAKGFTVSGVIPGSGVAGGSLGHSINTAGDVNADGLSDMIIGAVGVNANTGAGYVIFGTRAGFPSSFNLNTLNGVNGFAIPAILPGGSLGYSVSIVDDLNEDGLSDFIIGAPNVNSGAGINYVIFGSRGGFSPSLNLTNLNGTNGFTVPGLTIGAGVGVSVSRAGDINGDGVGDLILGAVRANSGVGASYVIFGGLNSSTWLKNTLTIRQGQTVLLSAKDVNATTLVPVFFVTSNVNGGRFERMGQSGISITNFTQQDVNSGFIQFVSDRTAPVSYNLAISNGTASLPPNLATVTFTNTVPQIISTLPAQTIYVNQPFSFSFLANETFMDPDGDFLTYSAQLAGGSALPAWLNFTTSQSNQLSFSGIAPAIEGVTQVNLFAMDVLNASSLPEPLVLSTVHDSSKPNSGILSTAQVSGGVLGAILGLGALLGAGFGFWRYATNKNTRKGEQFADRIRVTLQIKGVDDFDSEVGQQFVGFVHSLQSTLRQVGIDTQTMRPLELEQLAEDVADAARNKISPATDCLGRSVITVTDLNNKCQELVTEVQVLRNGGVGQPQYTV